MEKSYFQLSECYQYHPNLEEICMRGRGAIYQHTDDDAVIRTITEEVRNEELDMIQNPNFKNCFYVGASNLTIF